MIPEIVVHNQDRQPESIQYQGLIPLLVQQVQTQKVMIKQQEAEMVALQSKLEHRIAQLVRQIRRPDQVATR